MITALALSPSLDVTYLIDQLTVGAIHRPHTVIKLAGGKALNMARAALRIEGDVTVIAPLGGHAGDQIHALADEEGLRLVAVRSGTDARTCVSVISDYFAADGDITEFYEAAPALSLNTWNSLVAELAKVPTTGWTVLNGSVPATVHLEDLVSVLVTRRKRGERIAVDSHGAALDAIVDDVRPHLVKVNRSEAAELLGARDTGAIELARQLHERTGGVAIVTDGADGSVAVDHDGAWRALPDPEPGRFSVGSGDSYMAGLLVDLDAGSSLGAALESAAALGAANTRRPGGALFTAGDLAAARARVDVVAV